MVLLTSGSYSQVSVDYSVLGPCRFRGAIASAPRNGRAGARREHCLYLTRPGASPECQPTSRTEREHLRSYRTSSLQSFPDCEALDARQHPVPWPPGTSLTSPWLPAFGCWQMLLQPLIAIAICVLQNSSRSLLLLQLKQKRIYHRVRSPCACLDVWQSGRRLTFLDDYHMSSHR